MAAVRFVAVEGIDGSGKSTLVDRTCEELRRRDWLAIQLVEPTYGPYGRQARQQLSNGSPTAPELHRLFTLDRHQHVAQRVAPLLAVAAAQPAMRMVLVQDRSYYSAPAYQVDDPSCFDDVIAEQEAIAPRPDLVFLLDVSVTVATARLRQRKTLPFDFRVETHLQQARTAYLSLARRLPNFRLLDGSQPTDELVTQVVKEIEREQDPA